jgi:hypothetical protein
VPFFHQIRCPFKKGAVFGYSSHGFNKN